MRRTIEERALFTPDATAIVDRDGRAFSWHELNARANRLAELLGERNAQAQAPIAIVGPACAATVVGWLAAMKIDAPLIPCGEICGESFERAMAVLSPSLLLRTSEAIAVPATETLPALTLDLAGPVPSTPNAHSLNPPESTALLAIETTDELRVTHANLDELARWQSRALHPAGAVRVCSLSPGATLENLREIAATLGVGGTVCFSPLLPAINPALWKFLRDAGVSRLYIPSEQVELLSALSVSRGETLDRLRDFVVVGALHLTPDAMRLFTRHPHARVHLVHHAQNSSCVGACTLELPFVEAPPHHAGHISRVSSPTVLCKAGCYAARVATPAIGSRP